MCYAVYLELPFSYAKDDINLYMLTRYYAVFLWRQIIPFLIFPLSDYVNFDPRQFLGNQLHANSHANFMKHKLDMENTKATSNKNISTGFSSAFLCGDPGMVRSNQTRYITGIYNAPSAALYPGPHWGIQPLVVCHP